MREVRWERMFPDELEAAFAACPLVYFAYGLCEPHGPQNAVGLGAKAKEILETYDREPPRQRLRTFADVESLWENVVRPKLPEFLTMREPTPGGESVPEKLNLVPQLAGSPNLR